MKPLENDDHRVAIIKTSIAIQKALLDQADILAQRLNISRSHLFEIAVEHFIRNNPTEMLLDEMNKPDPNEQSRLSDQTTKAPADIDAGRLVINQGDVYWVALQDASESESGIPHPYVVIQENVINHSRIHTIVACALTSNIKRASIAGNILLEVGEAHLPKPSVVEVSKVSTIDKTQLGEYIGTLTGQRINQIRAGMRFLQATYFTR